MPTFVQLRDSVTPAAQKFFDFVWDYYLTKGDWPTNRVVYGTFKKEDLIDVLRKLDGSLVREVDSANGQKAFQLPLLGILCTSSGPNYLELLRRYMEMLRDIFFHESGIESVKHSEVQKKLGLTTEQTALLGRLVFSGFLRANGGYQPNFSEWGSSLPLELEDLPSAGSIDEPFTSVLNKLAAVPQAVFHTDRISAVGRSPPGDGVHTPALPDEYARPPVVFISYSHDSKDHKIWVLELAQRLHLENIDVVIDQWDLGPGDDIGKFMERGVTRADRVLMVCSEAYVKKVDEGKGGAGYEGSVVTGELIKDLGTAKFVPVIRQAGTHLRPVCVSTRAWINLSVGADTEDEIRKLISNLRKEPPPTKPRRGEKAPAPTVVQQELPEPMNNGQPAMAEPEEASAKIELNNSSEAYQAAIGLARGRDIVNWRKLVAEKKKAADEALKEWRAHAERNPPKLKKDLPEFARGGVTTQQSLFAIAVAGIESGEAKFNQQGSLVYDLLKPTRWDRAGLTLLSEFPETNAFVFQALVGAMCVYSNQGALAVDLATQRLTDRSNPTISRPLFLDHPIAAWPQAFESNSIVAWDFLLQLPDSFPWMVQAFGSADSYRECLIGYYLLLAWLEFVHFLQRHPNFDATTKPRLEIPPLYMRSPLFAAGVRRLLQDREIVAAYGKKLGIPVDRQLQAWALWVPVLMTWLNEVFRDFWGDEPNAEISNFAADIHR